MLTNGIGKVKEKYKANTELTDDVKTIFYKARLFTYALNLKINQEQENLENMQI